jgi:hypothetical protein
MKLLFENWRKYLVEEEMPGFGPSTGEAHGWQSEEERSEKTYEDERTGEGRNPYPYELAKDLFDRDRPKLLEFYSEVVSPWSRDGNGYEEGSKEKYRDGLEKHAPWLGITRHDSPSLNTPSTSKLMSGTDVRHYLREFHKQIVDLYGAAINNAEEGSQERQDLLVEFQGILEETKGVQANYIVNVLNIPEFDYLKDRTQEGGDNKTLGGYLNENILRKLIREHIRKHVRKEKI